MDKVRFGVIGVGGMGGAHAKYTSQMDKAELTAACDVAEAALEAAVDAYGVPGFDDHTALLDSGLVDAVIIATPHYFHPPIAIDAFQRGIHVLSEKPIAVTVAAADDMIAAAKASGLKFAVMFQMRSEPVYVAARKLIAEGHLGEIYRTCLVMGWYRSQAYYDSGGWRATWKGEGGGVLINQAPHLLDMFSWLSGMPATVQGETRTRIHNIEVEDEAYALLTYENGAHGYLYASTTEAPGTDLIEISGEKGKLRIQSGQLTFWELDKPRIEHSRGAGEMWSSPKAEEMPVELPDTDRGHQAITANFVEAILNDEPLIAPGPEGLNAVELINAMILSGKRGKPVELPVDRAEYDGLIEELKAESRDKAQVREQRVTDPQHA